MERHDDSTFLVNPPAELDAIVFAKVAPVLKENSQIHSNKRWFQVWMPVASTAALTAFGLWFLNKKAARGPVIPSGEEPHLGMAANNPADVDLQTFAALEMDEDSLEMANNLEVIEDLDLLEAYSDDEENS
tara:strand:+ start:37566 stop:37958 length:393 start_codon:yes stop_codon:yes gene_type:complete